MEDINSLLNKVSEPKFYGIKEVAEMMKWAIGTVQELFNRPDFPSTDFGREKKVERDALKEYFKVPRRKDR